MNALVLALSTAREAQVRADVERLVEAGHAVDLIVTKEDRWDDLGDGVTLHALSDLEYGHPLLRAERFVVLQVPRYVYTAVARVLQLLARVLPGGLGRRVDRAGGLWKRAWISTRETTRRFHKEHWGQWYSHVRPWFLWRATRRHVLPQLQGSWDVIVVADALSTPIGWQVARRLPEASVGFSLEEALDGRTDLGV